MEQFKNINSNFDHLINQLEQIKTKVERQKYLNSITGNLSSPSKMPCSGYSITAFSCKIGALLNKVKGSVCYDCYALKGRYIFPNVQNALQFRLNSIQHSMWVEAMTLQIALFNKGDKGYFRWHDSGDLQDVDHLCKIIAIAEYLPNTKFWLPTREYKIVNDWVQDNMIDDLFKSIPNNLTIRFSAHMIDSYKEVKNKQINSIVITSEDKAKEFNANICEATKKESSHKCEDCRACWNLNETIAYLKH